MDLIKKYKLLYDEIDTSVFEREKPYVDIESDYEKLINGEFNEEYDHWIDSYIDVEINKNKLLENLKTAIRYSTNQNTINIETYQKYYNIFVDEIGVIGGLEWNLNNLIVHINAKFYNEETKYTKISDEFDWKYTYVFRSLITEDIIWESGLDSLGCDRNIIFDFNGEISDKINISMITISILNILHTIAPNSSNEDLNYTIDRNHIIKIINNVSKITCTDSNILEFLLENIYNFLMLSILKYAYMDAIAYKCGNSKIEFTEHEENLLLFTFISSKFEYTSINNMNRNILDDIEEDFESIAHNNDQDKSYYQDIIGYLHFVADALISTTFECPFKKDSKHLFLSKDF